jgi:hypothetical protein
MESRTAIGASKTLAPLHFPLAGWAGRPQNRGDMTYHIVIGIAFAIMFLLFGCVAFLYLLRGKN